jgi:uncharacterized protein (DUF1810 family)
MNGRGAWLSKKPTAFASESRSAFLCRRRPYVQERIALEKDMPSRDDPFVLDRFVEAQDKIFDAVLAEMRAGQKRGHWMWFIFPQIAGLGFSPTADFFAIKSLAEAEAFLAHFLLGPRLRQCTEIVNELDGRTLMEIFGDPDRLKFRSCMTLFARAAPDATIFTQALRKYCRGEEDPLTLAALSRQQ